MGKNGNQLARPSKRKKPPASAHIIRYALCQLDDVKFARQAGFEPVLSPILGRFAAQDAPLLANLPVADANALLRESLEKLASAAASLRPVAAAFFAADPFLHVTSLFDLLRKSRITHLFNFPSVQTFDGFFADNLNRVGCGKSLEFARLNAAHKAGFHVIALIRDRNELSHLDVNQVKGYGFLPLPNGLPLETRALPLRAVGTAPRKKSQRASVGAIKEFDVAIFGHR
jgi:hypothetical protein